jgi:hypothetical protein
MGADEEQGRSKKPGLKIGGIVATVAALVGIATGVLTLQDQLFSDDGNGPVNPIQPEPREIPRYDGVAGHLSEGRALLDFLDQHNRESVYLNVGFPDHIGAPGGPTDNVVSRTEPYKGGTRSVITQVSLMTECDSDISPENTNPSPADICTGTGLRIDGPETEDTQTFFEHGVPRFKGYFASTSRGRYTKGLRRSI